MQAEPGNFIEYADCKCRAMHFDCGFEFMFNFLNVSNPQQAPRAHATTSSFQPRSQECQNGLATCMSPGAGP